MMNEKRLEEIIEKIIIDINEAMPALCDIKTQKNIDNTYREILTMYLSTLKEDKDNVGEMDDRDNDLVNIFNTDK